MLFIRRHRPFFAFVARVPIAMENLIGAPTSHNWPPPPDAAAVQSPPRCIAPARARAIAPAVPVAPSNSTTASSRWAHHELMAQRIAPGRGADRGLSRTTGKTAGGSGRATSAGADRAGLAAQFCAGAHQYLGAAARHRAAA